MNTPASFPNGAKLAVVIGMFFESFEGTPQPNPLPPVSGVEGRYVLADSWVDYGPAVGVNRLLDLLDQFQLPASFGISGLSAERYPEITRQIVDKGHEAVAHSYAQDIRVYTLDEEQERRNIERTVTAIETATGVRPGGWISPGFQCTANTPKLLAEAGFVWHGDYMDQDLPYLTRIGDRTLVAVPYVNDANDMITVIRAANPPMFFFREFQELFDYYFNQPDDSGLMVIALSVHAHIFARGSCIPALAKSLEHIKKHPNVWVARRGDLAQWCLDAN